MAIHDDRKFIDDEQVTVPLADEVGERFVERLVELARSSNGTPNEVLTILIAAVHAYALESSDPAGFLAGAVGELARAFRDVWTTAVAQAMTIQDEDEVD